MNLFLVSQNFEVAIVNGEVRPIVALVSYLHRWVGTNFVVATGEMSDTRAWTASEQRFGVWLATRMGSPLAPLEDAFHQRWYQASQAPTVSRGPQIRYASWQKCHRRRIQQQSTTTSAEYHRQEDLPKLIDTCCLQWMVCYWRRRIEVKNGP